MTRTAYEGQSRKVLRGLALWVCEKCEPIDEETGNWLAQAADMIDDKIP